jgi:hypothetical protein
LDDAATLRKNADASGRGIFVGGATDDTGEIRNELYRSHASFAQWYMQGHYDSDAFAPSTVSRIYSVINRSRVVVLLLGHARGSVAQQVPPHLLETAPKEWGDDLNLTYTECEYLIAKQLKKPLILCEVTTNDSSLRIRQVRGQDRPVKVDLTNCVNTIRLALEGLL